MRALLSSLAAFVHAGYKPRTPLARGIVIALALKLSLVVALRLFVFGGEDRPAIDPSSMDQRLLAPAAQIKGP